MIEFCGVSFVRDGKNILKDINLKIKSGENWLVLGPNGSGKSTLFSILMAYRIATTGKIKCFGREFGKENWNPVKDKIGIISSTMEKFNPTFFKMTVKEILISGIKKTIGIYEEVTSEEERIAEEYIKEYNLSTLKNEYYKNLSSGERKKVLIVRSLIQKPEVLILDEPCASLDIYERENILDTLRKTNTNLIYITHDVEETIPKITNVLLLKDGKIFKCGKKDEVLNSENLKKLYGIDLNLTKKNNYYSIEVKNRR
ncbi:ABC transporter ATP-binding protein [Peptoniphilus sp. SGI.035]|uniref:ABC transporter ATP-binding protein n=1 Tax=Peptoniphilus sp. SGI.035 TaxID=3420564 RepID=UPI003D07BA8D